MAKTNKAYSAHVEHQRLISKAIKMLEDKKIINEKDLRINRMTFKTIMATIRHERGLDVLTINRGRRTIGWILASEVLK